MISLRARVTLAAAVVLTVFVALTALALERAFAESARAAMRERLFAQLYLVMAAAEVDASGTLKMPERLGEARLNLPGSGLYARIGDSAGKPVWQSPSAVGLPLPSPPLKSAGAELFAQRELNGKSYFLAALAVDWEESGRTIPLLFSVTEDTAPFLAQMQRYRNNLWGMLGVMALLLLLALLAALAWGLRPLGTVAREVRAIESGKQERLTRDYPREINRLTDNINALLHHERAQQARYRNAMADLAHSLKTPLAVLRSLALSGEQAQTINEQVTRMDKIVQYQLQRAATAGRSVLASPLPVAPVAERLLASLQKVYRDKELNIHLSLDPRAYFRGDEGDLMELLGNLLDNACKWAVAGVWLEVRQEKGTLRLNVEDDGPGIAPHQAERVLKRGVRLDESVPGHGIGLPMVRDIVEAYDGKLEIIHSQHGGARIIVSLPM
ncbi:MAG TPA: ATP-binding protein [Gammaproteobacteria bacterium]